MSRGGRFSICPGCLKICWTFRESCAGASRFRKEAVDLKSVVNHAVEAALPFFDSCHHKLSISLPPDLHWVEGDATRLEQIVSNLLNNAAKYTEPGGRITITLVRAGDQTVLTVEDNGIGMTLELQAHVFDLFVQDDRSLDRARGGLGIGLTLVRNLVELHGGTVSAASRGPGQGSEFQVRLPLIKDHPAVKRQDSSPSTADAASPLRILVVDDNRDSANDGENPRDRRP